MEPRLKAGSRTSREQRLRDDAMRQRLLTDAHSPGQLPGVRTAHQPAGVLRRLGRQARRRQVPAAGGAREDPQRSVRRQAARGASAM